MVSVQPLGKFGRNFKIIVQNDSKEDITIKFPFTVQFDIKKSLTGATNQSTFQLFNLAPTTYGSLVKDPLVFDLRLVQFFADYNPLEAATELFTGNILESYTDREKTEVITYITALEGGFAKREAYSTINLAKGIKVQDVFDNLQNDLTKAGIGRGQVNLPNHTYPDGLSASGNTFDLMRDMFGSPARDVYITDNQVNIILTSGILSEEALVINEKTGLLGIPIKRKNLVEITTLLEPRAKLNRAVRLEPAYLQSKFQGYYKIISINHTGNISGAVGGTCYTKMELLALQENSIA